MAQAIKQFKLDYLTPARINELLGAPVVDKTSYTNILLMEEAFPTIKIDREKNNLNITLNPAAADKKTSDVTEDAENCVKVLKSLSAKLQDGKTVTAEMVKKNITLTKFGTNSNSANNDNSTAKPDFRRQIKTNSKPVWQGFKKDLEWALVDLENTYKVAFSNRQSIVFVDSFTDKGSEDKEANQNNSEAHRVLTDLLYMRVKKKTISQEVLDALKKAKPAPALIEQPTPTTSQVISGQSKSKKKEKDEQQMPPLGQVSFEDKKVANNLCGDGNRNIHMIRQALNIDIKHYDVVDKEAPQFQKHLRIVPKTSKKAIPMNMRLTPEQNAERGALAQTILESLVESAKSGVVSQEATKEAILKVTEGSNVKPIFRDDAKPAVENFSYGKNILFREALKDQEIVNEIQNNLRVTLEPNEKMASITITPYKEEDVSIFVINHQQVDNLTLTKKVLGHLFDVHEKTRDLTLADVKGTLHNARAGKALDAAVEQPEEQKKVDAFVSRSNVLVEGPNGKTVRARTHSQKEMVAAADKNDIIFGIGPAGTGKTYTAIALAVRALKNKEVKKIILTRPVVEAGENLGFLPGGLNEKMDPYLRPLYDALDDMIPADKLGYYLQTRSIEIAPLAYMRGRTLDHAFIIADEMQNATKEQSRMFITRIGTNAKAIITGDETQCDLPKRIPSGLPETLGLAEKIAKQGPGVAVIRLPTEDIVRHRLVKQFVMGFEAIDAENAKKDLDNNGRHPKQHYEKLKQNGLDMMGEKQIKTLMGVGLNKDEIQLVAMHRAQHPELAHNGG